jgi:hypothetical protein
VFFVWVKQEAGTGFNHAGEVVRVKKVFELLQLQFALGISGAKPAMIDRDSYTSIAGLCQQI